MGATNGALNDSAAGSADGPATSTPSGDQENLYCSGTKEASGAGSPAPETASTPTHTHTWYAHAPANQKEEEAEQKEEKERRRMCGLAGDNGRVGAADRHRRRRRT